MDELTISNTQNSMARTKAMLEKAKETMGVIDALFATGNKSAIAMMAEQQLIGNYQMGYVLGSLKANLDCLPDEIAARQRVNGIPLNLLIKMKVDEHVLDVRQTANPNEMTCETSYNGKYRRLSEVICGFGYSMTFSEERFALFFPNGTHYTVLGFAVGYSETFHEIAAQANVQTDYTDAKTQDIWKNWEYFLKRDVHEYRIDGKYLFMYHGGWNSSADRSIPYHNNEQIVNADVYDKLKARSASDFVDSSFDIKF